MSNDLLETLRRAVAMLEGHTIKDFCSDNALRVRPCMRKEGDLVVISQHAGSMNFDHFMTATQARELANALNDCADQIEIFRAPELRV